MAGHDADRRAADRSRKTPIVLLGIGLSILIFMMIIMYGTWVATSVVEEKSSRVMEVILNAATPFQLLTGKVLGVGAAALTQYAAVLLAGCAALFAQGWVASLVLGADASEASLPAGLTFGMLGLLVVYGVLGFLLFAVLYAGVGSLVSRQEDVNTVTMPLTLVCSAGYIVAVYTGLGLIDIRPEVMAVLSQVPFLSPFMMLSRITAGSADAVGDRALVGAPRRVHRRRALDRREAVRGRGPAVRAASGSPGGLAPAADRDVEREARRMNQGTAINDGPLGRVPWVLLGGAAGRHRRRDDHGSRDA